MKKYFSFFATIIVWAIGYYAYLPPINIKAEEFWGFLVFMVVTGLVINAYKIISQIDLRNLRGSISQGTKGVKILAKAALVFAAVYLIGNA
ncbi:hypothetical protein RFZ44_19220, partial [Acinetobacter sp. 163]|nr:hypothetical protein [Acinetobacter sp. 163]